MKSRFSVYVPSAVPAPLLGIAWLVVFATLGALLGLLGWALSWVMEIVRSYL